MPIQSRMFCIARALLATQLIFNIASVANAAEFVKEPARINVSGAGSIDVAPDMAIIQLSVVRDADSAREALSANNLAMKQVLDSMKETGIEDRDLQTSGFSIQPRYLHHTPKPGEERLPPKIVGYVVSNNLTVRIRDLSKTGEILDRSVSLGVNSGGQISFTNDDPSAAISIARTNAMKDAIDRARTLAEAAGVALGPIISIDENFNHPGPVPMARGKMMMEASAADSVPIAAGENSYSINVNVSWEIKQ